MKSILMIILFSNIGTLALAQDQKTVEIYGNFLIPAGTLSPSMIYPSTL